MPGYLLTMNCVVTCAHGGQAKAAAPNPRVKIMGTPTPQITAPFLVSGCSLTTPLGVPTPCITAAYIPATGTVRVKSMGQPLLCATSTTGLCVTTPPAPPGPLLPITFAGQVRVKGQ